MMVGDPIRWMKELGLATVVRINPGSLPDFLIVGAQKAGTSSLFAALTSHPMIGSSFRKEVHFFDLRHDSHLLSWYAGHFPPRVWRRGGKIVGEASPSYMFFPYCAEAIASVCPKTRILIVLRDPVKRAVSHYHHNRRLVPHLETETDAATALFAENARIGKILDDLKRASPEDRARAARFSYLARGHYAEQIMRFQLAFGAHHVMIIDTDDLASAQQNGIGDRLCDFLGVPRHPLVFEQRNAGKQGQPIEPELLHRLAAYFAPHDAQLSTMLGRKLSWHTEMST